MFDPHGWSEDSYYEGLGKFSSKLCLTFKLIWIELTTSVNYLCAALSTAKAQKVEMDKLEKAKKEKTKVRAPSHSTYLKVILQHLFVLSGPHHHWLMLMCVLFFTHVSVDWICDGHQKRYRY